MKIIFDVKDSQVDEVLKILKNLSDVEMLEIKGIKAGTKSTLSGSVKEIKINVKEYEKGDEIWDLLENLDFVDIKDYHKDKEEWLWGLEQSIKWHNRHAQTNL
ncbi:MAG: hypothetical protein OXC92_10590 [Flavobacteriaceae bacterium]|nr:hypothetical protein [Flavobacteriaceae bacterium]